MGNVVEGAAGIGRRVGCGVRSVAMMMVGGEVSRRRPADWPSIDMEIIVR